jgi:hypothetical protein
MSIPAKIDRQIWRGTNGPRMIWKMPFDMTGDDWVLTITWNGGSLERRISSGGLSLDLTNKWVIWPYTADESRMIPLGNLSVYELERRAAGGEQRVYAYGRLEGCGGVNTDV